MTAAVGMAPLTAARLFGSWRLDPGMLAVALVAGGGYLRAVSGLRRRGLAWPLARTLVFVGAGCGGLVFVTMSGLGSYGRVLFWPVAVRYTVLVALLPVAFAAGDPVGLARLRLGPVGTRRLDRVLASLPVRVLTFPALAAVLAAAGQLAVFFTSYLALAVRHQGIDDALELQLLVTGCLFTLPMFGVDLLPDWCTFPVRLLFAFADGLLDAIPGVVVMTSSTLVAGGFYATVHRSWGPTVAWDQTIGGGLMFTITEIVAVPFLGALLLAWIRADAAEARQVDTLLDRGQPLPVGPGEADLSIPGRPELMRPWWEVGPSPYGGRRPRPPDDA